MRPLRLIFLSSVVLALFTGSVTAQDSTRRKGFSITIAEPPNQTVVFGRTKIVADLKSTDASQVERVEFIVGDTVVFVDRESPWEYFHDFGAGDRSNIVKVVAHHIEGVTVSDTIVTRKLRFVTVDRVNRVLLWVTATDKKGDLITDLEEDDFVLNENGEPQKIIDFYREDRPITMAILVDTSGSMRDKLKDVHEAAGDFVSTLRPEDKALVIDFNANVFLIQDLTADHEALRKSIESTEAFANTALYDALHASYRRIGDIEGRKAIVVLSDGEDTISQFSYQRVLKEAKSNNTMIFSIGLGYGGGGADTNVLKELSASTGGQFFYAKKPQQLVEIYARIAEELRAQFYISYSTNNEKWDGHWIKLKVHSKRDDVSIRARRGYFAVRREDG
ncbi:MAG: VWA domain-containing protein [Acidobacteriota bacterium]|nr:VWA domain-containing protein [Acidobacteriota bacterium]MDH3786056.1 VWA domain-containing protein [Acidobacteriota bacterium]